MTRRQAEAMPSSPPWPASLSSQVAAFRSWTKQSSTDSEHRAALLHGHFQVVGHTHRAHRKSKAGGETPDRSEAGPGHFRGTGRAHGHEASDIEAQVRECDDEVGYVTFV